MKFGITLTEVRSLFAKYRDEILNEVLLIDDLMYVLTKGLSVKWTSAELALIKNHFTHIAKRIPAIALLLAPGGFILLPVLAEVLDRRQRKKQVDMERRQPLAPAQDPRQEYDKAGSGSGQLDE